ncbi:creatininase family protein [Natronomonas sp. EA1]|uniref:creatininase family protein n=1 Tax=Natronomonas sp. EA1 TaxID=3421655 RepID=UPI003EC1322A
MHLADSTWTDVRDTDADVALLPVGSTEQHGPHAPLGLDFLAAEAVADAGAEAYVDTYGREALVAPTLPIGIAEEHRAFDGTLWLSPDTFRANIRETVGSLAHHGFSRVVVVNGHGGNVDALGEVCATISRQDASYAVPFTWFDAIAAEGMGHAGKVETALMRHLHPELVHEDRTQEAKDGAADRWGEWLHGVNLAHDSSEFTDSGVVGDPTTGSAALGEELLEEAAMALAEVADAVATRAR